LTRHDSNAPRRILLVRTSAIGDIVFASPLAAAFRRAYPQAHLAWLVQPECAPLLIHHPDLDEVIPWPYRTWRRLWQARRWPTLARQIGAFRAELRERRFDLAVDLQGLLKSGLLTRLSGAGERIGLGSREGSQWLMTRTVPRGGDPARIGSEYLYLAETLGLPVGGFEMQVYYGPEETAFADDLIEHKALTGGYAVLCPFTTRPQKHWFEDRWAALARRLSAVLGLPAVMLGGPADREAARRIHDQADGGLIDLAGETDLLQAAAVIDRSALLVAVDTGLGHMGIAFGRPSLLLFGSTCPYRNTTRANARVLYHPMSCSPCRRKPTCHGAFTCMKSIEVSQVISAALDLVGRAP
jgi:heptosyltransferase-1